MSTFIWRNTVKVVTSELTRGAQLGFWRDFAGLDTNTEEVDLLGLVDEVLAVRATRALFICKDGEWVPVESAGTFYVEDIEYTLTMPPTQAGLRDLPASLANEWVQQAQQDNEVIRQYLFFTSADANSLTMRAELPSDSEGSNVLNESPPETKTTGE